MSHNVGGTEIKAEPNLVPLLDLVFQLIMFFMICVNFVSEQVNEDIKLPEAQSARPMEKSQVDVLFLNLDQTGKLIVPGEEQPLVTLGQKQYYLRQQYADTKRKDGQVHTAIIVRADRNTNYGQLFELLHLCKQAGYRKMEIRAYTKAGS
jgi:biopolymer transport protein ExbD